MAYAITQACCNDASCVSVCPVDCIHPTPEERAFGRTEMLYIDPRSCIDCGACADACPVDAISPLDLLTGPDAAFGEINAAYYADRGGDEVLWDLPRLPSPLPRETADLRVAIVGTGPAASYAAQTLLPTGAVVTMIDRLPVPGGLLRYGVAPDHPATKRIGDRFASLYDHPRVRLALNVEVGRDVTHDEVLRHHHAVIYAVGASDDHPLGVPGEELQGVVSARSFVAWYNAHPDANPDPVDLSSERAVVVGNGNVALDVARILLADPERLAATDIADHALAALRRSNIREVVLLGRRGPEDAAYSTAELLALLHDPHLDVVVRADPGVEEAIERAERGSKAALLQKLPVTGPDWQAGPPERRRIVLAFHTSVTAIDGSDSVERVYVRRAGSSTDDDVATIPTGVVLTSIGYRGTPVPGLPFDRERCTVRHSAGRVVEESGRPVRGAYVTGWIKRGPSGGIGTNRQCAEETVASLLADLADGRLAPPSRSARDFERLLRGRRRDIVGRRHVAAIDRAERRLGAASGRPRVKLATVPELLDAAGVSRTRLGRRR